VLLASVSALTGARLWLNIANAIQVLLLTVAMLAVLRRVIFNAGVDSPAGGTGATDADGGTRKIGKHVDIGAYESDVLFRNGFEAP